ncbi:MAG: hypothetical protein NXI24_15325 [bacterium]|nr:hypothetical protein [bacterium]
MLRIAFIVIGTLGMFAAIWIYGDAVHYPALESFCDSSCAAIHSDAGIAKIESGYVGSSITEGCRCQRAIDEAAPESGDIFDGYFFTNIAALDWFLLVWFRLIPLAVIGFFSVLLIAKIVPRLP